MKISENTSVSMPRKNMIGIVIAVAMGVFAYTEVQLDYKLDIKRIVSKLIYLKNLNKNLQDQEQFMLIESLFGDVEKLITNQEQNMTNKVNIEFLKTQLRKSIS